MSDLDLKKSIDANKAQKEKYQRVVNSIRSNGLSSMRTWDDLDYYIEHCENIIGYLDSDQGYHYLSNYRNKLEDNVKILKEYRTFVTDSNKAFINLYNTLEAEINNLNTIISQEREAYNKGKYFWEKI